MQFEYDHSIYWPALIKLAAERRQAYQERWVRGGKRVGESEAYLKGGVEKSISEAESPTAQTIVDSVTGLPVNGVTSGGV